MDSATVGKGGLTDRPPRIVSHVVSQIVGDGESVILSSRYESINIVIMSSLVFV